MGITPNIYVIVNLLITFISITFLKKSGKLRLIKVSGKPTKYISTWETLLSYLISVILVSIFIEQHTLVWNLRVLNQISTWETLLIQNIFCLKTLKIIGINPSKLNIGLTEL
jgi:hypothetical protein